MLSPCPFLSRRCRVVEVLLVCVAHEETRRKEHSWREWSSSSAKPYIRRLLQRRPPIGRCAVLWANLRHVVVGLAQWAACSPTGEPRVDARTMESVPTGEASHIVVVVQCIQTDGTRVTRCCEHLRWCCSTDRVVIVIVYPTRHRGVAIFQSVGRLCSLNDSLLCMFLTTRCRLPFCR